MLNPATDAIHADMVYVLEKNDFVYILAHTIITT